MLRAALAAASLAVAGAALACGYCVEDKIASTYDHALVSRAMAQGHHVAFYHLDGPLSQDEATKRMLAAATESIKGIDKGSVRIALHTLTLSFAYDPGRASLASVQNALDRKLAVRKLSLLPMRIIERPAELKEIPRR